MKNHYGWSRLVGDDGDSKKKRSEHGVILVNG